MPVTRRRAPDVRPNRTEPSLHFLLASASRAAFLESWRGPVCTALAKKQNVLDVVLDDSAGLVRLPVESCAIPFDLSVGAVGDLVQEGSAEGNRDRALRARTWISEWRGTRGSDGPRVSSGCRHLRPRNTRVRRLLGRAYTLSRLYPTPTGSVRSPRSDPSDPVFLERIP